MEVSTIIFNLDFDKTEIKVASKINNNYEIVDNFKFSTAFLSETLEKQKEIISIYKNLKTKYKGAETSLCIYDSYFKDLKIKEDVSIFKLKKNSINETNYFKILESLKDINDKLKYSKYQWNLFKLFIDEETIKKYNHFPFDKKGDKLEIISYLIELDMNSEFQNLLTFFEKFNLKFKHYFLKSQVIVPSYGTLEGNNIFINIESNAIIINTFFNGVINKRETIYSNLKEKIIEILSSKNIFWNVKKIHLFIKSIFANWKYFNNNNSKNEIANLVTNIINKELEDISLKILKCIDNIKNFDKNRGYVITKGFGANLINKKLLNQGYTCKNHDPFYSNEVLKNDILSGILFLTKNYVPKILSNVNTLDKSMVIKTKPKKIHLFNINEWIKNKKLKKQGERECKIY